MMNIYFMILLLIKCMMLLNICDEDYIHRDMVVIIDDDKECTYFFYDGSNLQPLFEDVTLEYRSGIIDDILC